MKHIQVKVRTIVGKMKQKFVTPRAEEPQLKFKLEKKLRKNVIYIYVCEKY